ncbi:MAG: DUF5689 domain-containing protein [Bacteroidota bacterium]
MKTIFTFKKLVPAAIMVAAFASSDASAQLKSIAEAKQQDLGSIVTKITGRVTVANQFNGPAYIQDASGGIAVFNSQFSKGIAIGDSVIVENGTLTEFQATTGQPRTGLTQLSGDLSFTVVPNANKEVIPRTINSLATISESTEGELVKLTGVTFVQTGIFQGETTYQIKNAFNQTLDVRIDGSTNLADLANPVAIPTGKIDFIGVISQFRGNYQILPRFAKDLSIQVEIDTVSKSRTLDVTTWNLYWFGGTDTAQGIANKESQYKLIAAEMKDSLQSDLYALQEIAGESYFNRLRDTLGYGGILAKEIDQDQKTGFLYNKNVIDTISSGLAVNGGSQAWGNGRFPFRLDFRATINGIKQNFSAFVIHGKATGQGTEVEDRKRREDDAKTFYDYLNSFYSDKNVIVLGDFNDDVTRSVVKNPADTAKFLPSPYKVFTDDVANYTVATKTLSEQNVSTYVRFEGGTIDNIIFSNELSQDFYRVVIEDPRDHLTSYTSRVSDHLPVTARFYVTGTGTSVEDFKSSNDFTCRINNGMIEFAQTTPGNVKISLVNVLGTQVEEILNGNFAEGIQVRRLSLGSLSSGAYYLHIQKGAATQVIPVVIAK